MTVIYIKTEMPVKKSGAEQPPQNGSMPDAEALEKISRYTRRKFGPDELYVFPVALCDNEIDRDGERFTVDALRKLAELFVGKTGVFDHDPQAKNQTARIYDCRVERDETRLTSRTRALWRRRTCPVPKRTATLSPGWSPVSKKKSASGARCAA